jgi:leucyl aminopeptidase
MMKFRINDTEDITKIPSHMIVVNKFEDSDLEGDALVLDTSMNGALKNIVDEEGFTGKDNTCLMVHTLGSISGKKIALLGLGKKEEFTLDKVRRAAGVAVKKAEEAKAASIGFSPIKNEKLLPEDVIQAMVEGAALASYKFDKYLEKKEEKKDIEEIEFLTAKSAPLEQAIHWGVIISRAVNYTRDIVNEPANIVTPEVLAQKALELSEKPGLSCRILEQEEMEKMGMGAALAVARGSANPPRFIHITYTPSETAKSKIAIVGKGLTFDSGGLNIKVGDHMKTMKIDKSGACSVLGVMSALPDLQPKIEVHGIIAACENMPGSRSYRPDDILRAMNGKTIEVINTDAEGRLTLADALSYAITLKPDRIIDLATLTGACVIALGEFMTGVMGNNQTLIDEILENAKNAGEKMWQLPFDEQLKEKLKCDVADIKNLGDRYGGTITAGLFLENFVDSIPWVHLDIAGPSFNEKGWYYNPKGASGVAVRTLLKYLMVSSS